MKIKIYSLLLLISVIFTGNSQVLIGQGNTTTGQFTPFKPYWRYTYSQSIYLSSEINASGKITSIEWYFEGTTAIPNSDNITVYMSTTSKTSFGSTSDWIPVANMTKVFEGAIVMNSPIGTGWKKITLTTPFDYDGISNLVIATDENDPETESPDLTQNFYNFDTGNNRSIYAVNGTTDINPLSPPVANNLKTFVPNIIIGGIAPACETPQYLSVSNVTQTTATVSWQNLVNTIPSRGSEYYISTSTNKPNDSTIPTGAINGGTSANLTNLQPGTTYLVYVRNNCADGINSSWSPAVKLTTSCPDSYDTFYENFDSLNTSPKNLPNCWSKIIRANAGSNICPSAKVDALVSEANATSGTNSVYMSNCNSDGDYDIILISPALSNLDKGTHRLIFNSRGGILEVGTLDNNTADAKFTLFKTYDESNQNAFTNTILNFDNYIGTDKYIGIRVKQTNPQQTYFYIDDISWSAIPNCPDVTQVKATEVTDITATIGWSDAQVGGAESWDIAVGDPSVTNPDLLPFNNTPDSGTYLIENLQPATQYKAWVRSVCAGNEKGDYIGPVLFTTNCATAKDFNENFNSAPLGGLPQCWSKIVKPNSGVLGVQSNVAATDNDVYNGTRCVTLSSGNAEGDADIILVSPRVSTLKAGSNYRLRFASRFSSKRVEIGTVNSSTENGTFTLFKTVEFNATGAREEYKVDFSTYNGPNEYIAIRIPNIIGSGFWGISLDNIIWEPVPQCPEISEVAVIETFETAAMVNWKSTPTESAWDITYGPSSSSVPEDNFPIVTTDKFPYLITGLTSGTTYNVWVRSNCDGEGKGKGEWIGPIYFVTECPTIGSFTENFDNPATTALPDMTTCWTKIMRGQLLSQFAYIETSKVLYSNFFEAPYNFSSPNCVIMTAQGSSKEADLILVSPRLNNLRGKNRLIFDSAYPGRLQIGTVDGNTKNAKFTPITEFLLKAKPDGKGGWYNERTVINITNYQGSDDHLAIRLMPNPDAFAEPDPEHPEDFLPGFPSVWFDNFVWEPIPGCIEVKDITVANPTAITTATASWTAGQDETQWEVVYDNTNITNPDDIAKINTVNGSPTITLTDLLAGTTYKMWVRAVCGDSNSAWVGPVTFTTQCVSADVPYVQDFNSAIVPNLPNCTSETYSGNSAYWFTSNPSTGNNYTYDTIKLELVGGLDQSLNAWFYTQGINLIQGEKYYISYKYGSNSNASIFLNNLKVMYGTSNSEAGMTLPLANYLFYYGYDNTDKISFIAPSTGVYYFGFNAYSIEGQGRMFLDTITIDKENLSVNDFDNSNFSYSPNPVKDVLNLSYINKISSATVYNLLGQKVSVRIFDNNTKIDMSSLANGTYMVKLVSDNQLKTIKIVKE